MLVPYPALGDADPWWGKDKALHFSACLLLAVDGYATEAVVEGPGGETNATARELRRVLGGFALALAAGAGKEVYDGTTGGDASLRDLTWDAVGGLTGAAISWAFDRYVFPYAFRYAFR